MRHASTRAFGLVTQRAPTQNARVRVGIDTSFVVPRATGIGVYARLLVESFGRCTPQKGFYCYGGEISASAPNVTHRSTHPWKPWRYAARLATQLYADRVDVFHAVANFLAPVWLPCPFVVTLHDLIPFTHPETVSRKHRLLARTWTPFTLRRARRIICVSPATARDVVAQFPRVQPKVRVVLNGVRTLAAPLDAIARVRAAFELPRDYIVAVSAIEPRKNFALLAEVWRSSQGELPPLVVAGQRWHAAESIEREADGKVRFLGFVPDADLGPLIAGATLFVFPSRAEGFGYPPLEAMRLGVPVVAAGAGALPELLDDGARLLSPDDAPAWRSEIVRLLRDGTARRELALRGLGVAGRFDMERCARETVAVYEEAMRDARPF
ncbi:MAG: glycosyltransferase family 4 protein [Deltaproteobacteria bacterium]|nr:glycosyltransferase family 4 protein [Deltaproteobacteria bacterium]